jgi:hypothetical protein
MDKTTVERALELLRDRTHELNPALFVVSYNDEADSLMVHLYGRGIPAVSVLVTDDVMVRYDRVAERVIGFQLDHFRSILAKNMPELLNLLDLVDLQSAAPNGSAALQRIPMPQREQIIDRTIGRVADLALAAA